MSATYPTAAGWKARDTSRAAAEAITPKAPTLRARVLEAIQQQPGSADDIAIRLGVSWMSVRPRCSELAARGLIEDGGLRDIATGGKRCIVWRAAQ